MVEIGRLHGFQVFPDESSPGTWKVIGFDDDNNEVQISLANELTFEAAQKIRQIFREEREKFLAETEHEIGQE